MLLALYPFRRQLRFSMAVTLALAILLVATHISIGLLSALHPGQFQGLLSLTSTAIYAIFYFVAVKVSFGKKLFTLLMLSNVVNMAVTAPNIWRDWFLAERWRCRLIAGHFPYAS